MKFVATIACVVVGFLVACSSNREELNTAPKGASTAKDEKQRIYDFSQEIKPKSKITTLKAVSKTILPVTIRNVGNDSWNNEGPDMVTFSYQWWANGQRIVAGARTVLPQTIGPGQTADLDAVIIAPEQPGAYELRLTMVRESVQWFCDAGGAFPDVKVTVSK